MAQFTLHSNNVKYGTGITIIQNSDASITIKGVLNDLQPDWNETNSESFKYINNKPDLTNYIPDCPDDSGCYIRKHGSWVSFPYDPSSSSLVPTKAVRVYITGTPLGRWYIDNDLTTEHVSGESVSNLTLGTHTIRFKAVAGFITPEDKTVIVSTDSMVVLTVDYVEISSEGYVYYGVYPDNQEVSRINMLTADKIKDAGTKIAAKDKAIDITTQIGKVLFAAVPTTYKALIDNGAGGKVQFVVYTEGVATGANGGIYINIDGLTYELYGELSTTSADTVLYIEKKA